jgi:hypothetical protein
MTLLKNCEVYFCKLDPKHPNAKFNKAKPTWEVQIRTTDTKQKKEWEELGLKSRLIVEKEGSENEGDPILRDGKKEWRFNLQKKSITKDGEKASPVKVVNAKLEEINPNSIGHGSVANIRIFQYEYVNDGKKGIASVLMGMQVVKHIVYTPKPRDDDFEETEGETIVPEGSEEVDEDDIAF